MANFLNVDCLNKTNFNLIVDYLENNEEMVKMYKHFAKIELLNTIQFKISDEFEFDMLKHHLDSDLLVLKLSCNATKGIEWNIKMA